MPDYYSRLTSLRNAMKEKEIDAFLIPSTDPHLSEYIPDHWRIVSWLTGFTGSAGTLVITSEFAGLWTDSRYYLQAARELEGTGCVMMKINSLAEGDPINWLAQHLKKGSVLASDSRIMSLKSYKRIHKLSSDVDIEVKYDCDLIAEIWDDRPLMPVSKAFDLPMEFCGKDRIAKIAEVRQEMKNLNVDSILLSDPDEIMWLLNIRGADSSYNPVIFSFAILNESQMILFVEESQIPLKLAMEFDKLGIVMLPYEEIEGMLSATEIGTSLLIDPAITSASLYRAVPEGVNIIEGLTPACRMKSVKNQVEIKNIERTMIKDGVALTKLFYWFYDSVSGGNLKESDVSSKIDSLRAKQEDFLSPSFETIAAWNANGALPHYRVSPVTDLNIDGNGIFLLDSGGQYLTGTTDITRTVALGKPTSSQKRDFTLVLKGMISLATVRFPGGTRGIQLDSIARKPLWDDGLNYGHGTGHGVGYCLGVHERPHSISPSTGAGLSSVLEPGVLISNEPAIYREGEYGIRTENLMLCYEDEETEFGRFLKFDTLSLCYIDKSLIEKSLMEQKELDWLNSYHNEVYEKLSPFLEEDEKLWLKDKTEPI